MKQEIFIYRCYHNCTFFETEQGGVMYCNHPYFEDKSSSESYIINHDNSKNTVPDKCPLRESDLTITYKFQDNK